MNKEQASEAYIKGKLRNHQEYHGCDENRRMTLIQSDMYVVQQAFEDGYDAARKELLDKIERLKHNIHKYIINVSTDDVFKVYIVEQFWKELRESIN